jgi:hypothetical protein
MDRQKKNEIIQSRTVATLCINTWLQTINHVPDIYIGASAIGYYGDRAFEILDEKSSPGSGFYPPLLITGKRRIIPFMPKKAIIRIGVVLSLVGPCPKC